MPNSNNVLQRTRTWLLVACVGLLFVPSLRGDDSKKPIPEADEPVIEVDPEGEPSGYDKPPRGPTCYIWRTGDTWHVRTKTKSQSRKFNGSIKVEGGTVTKIANFEGLETPKKKNKKSADIGRLNTAKNQIDFQFRTSGGEDGFDFRVSASARNLAFNLKIDDYEHSFPIEIGAKGQRPPAIPFTLPAHAPKADAEAAATPAK